MANDGAIANADAIKKEMIVSRSWILMDSGGEETILDDDKYKIMHRVQIHARDLRVLDPLLSYPSTVLGREGAIVLNLEHIKAIITADEQVLLRDPLEENVIPIVEELRRRLSPSTYKKHQHGDGGGHHDGEAAEEDESTFEFRALEVALEAICSFLDARTTEQETAAYPALDELTSKGKYARASKRYEKGAKLIEHDSSFSEDEKKQSKPLKVAINLNNAACKLKLKDYKEAANLCTKVLELESRNAKALYKRAHAYVNVADFDLAETDIKKALEVDPDNRDVKLEYKTLKEKMKEFNKKKAKFQGNMFAIMTKLSRMET